MRLQAIWTISMRIFFLMIVILLGAASRAAEVQKTEGVWKIVDRQSRSIMSAGSDGRVIKGIEALCGESGTMVLRLLLVQPQSGQLAIG
jgi:hypothetical protein